MFSRLVAALLLLLPAAASAATDIVRVWCSYRTVDSFKRVSEYFGGPENTGSEIVRRSQPDDRAGYYFLVRIRSDAAVPRAALSVEVVMPGEPTPKRFAFAADLTRGEQVFQLGLTGRDWPGVKVQPSAWRVAAEGADGGVLATRQSFLWSADRR